MSETKFLGVRLEQDIFKLVEDTATEEHKDKSSALRQLILLGRQKLREKNAIEAYRDGKISTDKAAEIAGLTVTEIMTLLANAGLTSEETFADYAEGIRILTTK